MADDPKLPCDGQPITKSVETAAKYPSAKEARDEAEKLVKEAAIDECEKKREDCIGHAENPKILCKFTEISPGLVSSAEEKEVAEENRKVYKWLGKASITGKCECKTISGQ